MSKLNKGQGDTDAVGLAGYLPSSNAMKIFSNDLLNSETDLEFKFSSSRGHLKIILW